MPPSFLWGRVMSGRTSWKYGKHDNDNDNSILSWKSGRYFHNSCCEIICNFLLFLKVDAHCTHAFCPSQYHVPWEQLAKRIMNMLTAHNWQKLKANVLENKNKFLKQILYLCNLEYNRAESWSISYQILWKKNAIFIMFMSMCQIWGNFVDKIDICQ